MKNCRFLQGAGTSQATIGRIRQACKYGQPLTELILNYRKDGVPFWSLFRLIPLRNANGKLKYLLGAQENVTNVLSATPDLAHLLDDKLDPYVMAPRPPFEHDLAGTQMHDTGEAMRNYLKSLDRGATTDKPANSSPRPSTPNRSMLSVQGWGQNVGNSPVLGGNNNSSPTAGSSSPTPRPRSANRDMHLHAAAALAFDGTMGTVNPARGGGQSWSQAPVHPRPTTSNSIFARPDTAYSMVDTKGREDAQLSLAEKTKAFNEASSHYLVLDSTCDMVLFHSANLPATIRVGSSFPDLIGSQLAQQFKSTVTRGDRADIRSASLAVPPIQDPEGIWRGGVKLAVTPLKDQINEVGAVIVLISNNALRK
ncbi:hypothetical protein P389DRAFT_86721 [Cystobasidium minutum MCA 4210]|uniref:uncharacterized protein n=1 Tax=Cystobasidium minutum MCA 4210 TaxID=1397322 RepID=UPI0034CEFCF2|eukprot:jgi/Rhomi1/86721/CE86720_8068